MHVYPFLQSTVVWAEKNASSEIEIYSGTAFNVREGQTRRKNAI